MPIKTRWGIRLILGIGLLLGAASAAPPTVSISSPPPPGRVGYAFSFSSFSASNQPTSYSATGLPAGLTINSSSGEISGTPTVAATSSVILSARNADGAGTASVSITIEPGPTAPPVIANPDSWITSRPLPVPHSTTFWQAAITASNWPTRYDVAGLPPNVSVNRDTGFIALIDPAPGIYDLTMSATNPVGTSTKSVRLSIHPTVLSIRLEPGDYSMGQTLRVSVNFDGAVTVTGTPTVELLFPGMPTRRARYASGSGTNSLAFTYVTTADDFTTNGFLGVIDAAGGTIKHTGSGLDARLQLPTVHWSDRSREFRIFGPVEITSARTASGTVGAPFTYAITARNAPAGPAVARGLPQGLSLVNDRTISGTPTTAGTYPITLELGNGSYWPTPGTATLTLTIAPAVAPPSTTTPPATTTPAVITTPAVVTTPPATTTPAVITAPTVVTTPTVTTTTPPVTVPAVITPSPAAAQTIQFVPPAAVIVGQPLSLAATASSGLPVSLTVASGNATLSGTQLTVNNAGTVVVRATQTGSSAYLPATADITLSASRRSQTLDFVSPVSAVVIGQPISLSALASSGLPVTLSIVSGPATIDGSALTVTGPGPVVVRATQPGTDSVNAATSDVTITGAVRGAQSVAFAAPSTELLSDRTLSLAATSSSGLPVTFEILSGPAILEGTTLRPIAAAGTVVLRALQSGSPAFAAAESTRTLTILPSSRLINLSSRVMVRQGDASRSFIAGFVVSGDAPKRMLLRAIGPALANFGLQAALTNPRLRLFDQAGRLLAENDDWSGAETAAAFARVGAFALVPGSRDAALLTTLAPGAYSLHIETSEGEGIALAEIYDASDSPALETQQMINISTRAFAGTGEAVLAAGFVVTGSQLKRVLIRGVGPGLGAFGVTGVLADPQIKIYQGSAVLAQNDDWQIPQPVAVAQPTSTAPELADGAARAGAFALSSGGKDAALIMTLPPGVYTAIVSGANDTTGAALVEVYELR